MTDGMKAELRECPWCGCGAIEIIDQHDHTFGSRCENCGAAGPSAKDYGGVRVAWNHRPGEEAAYQRGVEVEREACARIVEGDIYKERYRTWPHWPPGVDGGTGNYSNQNPTVKHCDEIAAAIRARGGEAAAIDPHAALERAKEHGGPNDKIKAMRAEYDAVNAAKNAGKALRENIDPVEQAKTPDELAEISREAGLSAPDAVRELVARRINDSERPWAIIDPNGPHGDEIVAGCIKDEKTARRLLSKHGA